MAQTGDPTGTGRGGSGKNLKAEFSNAPHERGPFPWLAQIIPIARIANSSFASTTLRFLDGKYTVWGRVIEGMENVDKVKRGEPVKDPDKILSMRVGASA